MKILGIAFGILAVSAGVAMAQVDGAEIYMAKCKKCHGENGLGEPKALEKLCKGLELEKLSLAPIAEKSDADVRKLTVEGKEKMPAYAEKLTPEEIDAVVAYCRKLIPAK